MIDSSISVLAFQLMRQTPTESEFFFPFSFTDSQRKSTDEEERSQDESDRVCAAVGDNPEEVSCEQSPEGQVEVELTTGLADKRQNQEEQPSEENELYVLQRIPVPINSRDTSGDKVKQSLKIKATKLAHEDTKAYREAVKKARERLRY